MVVIDNDLSDDVFYCNKKPNDVVEKNIILMVNI